MQGEQYFQCGSELPGVCDHMTMFPYWAFPSFQKDVAKSSATGRESMNKLKEHTLTLCLFAVLTCLYNFSCLLHLGVNTGKEEVIKVSKIL